MNLNSILASGVVSDLGLTLLHSFWQISLIAFCLSVSLRALRLSAPTRHNLCVFALLVCIAVPAATFVGLRSSENSTLRRDLIHGKELYSPTSKSTTPGVQETVPIEFEQGGSADSTGVARLSAFRTYVDQSLPTILPLIVALWFLGMIIFSARLAGGLMQLRRYRKERRAASDPEWQRCIEDLCQRIAVPFKARIAVSQLVSTPISIGFFKPLILIPAAAAMHISPKELEMVIAHELIHLRRFDPLVSVIQGVVETLLFYHPAVWWISAQIRSEREFATDLAVLESFDESETAYARALATLEELRRATASNDRPRIAPAANGGNFMERIDQILNGKTEGRKPSSAWSALLAFALTSAFVLGAFWFNPTEVVNAQHKGNGKKIAIGFVSIPPIDRSANPPLDGEATTRLLIDALKRNKVPALGFLQGGMVSDGEKLYPVRAATARLWLDAGFEIGLGGYKHISLYNTPVGEYIANIEKNEKIAKQLIGDMGQPPRYFSYPFLNTGKTDTDRAKVEAWLATRGYTPVKYTVDNNEWMYSYAYDMARNDNDIHTMREIRESYLDYMSKMIDHFDAYSADMFGRDIPQTMVLTSSRLVTDTADEFFKILKKKDYSFVSVDEAQSDAAYKTPENFTGDAGISWFERWAMAKDQPLRNEPKVDPSVEAAWNAKKN